MAKKLNTSKLEPLSGEFKSIQFLSNDMINVSVKAMSDMIDAVSYIGSQIEDYIRGIMRRHEEDNKTIPNPFKDSELEECLNDASFKRVMIAGDYFNYVDHWVHPLKSMLGDIADLEPTFEKSDYVKYMDKLRLIITEAVCTTLFFMSSSAVYRQDIYFLGRTAKTTTINYPILSSDYAMKKIADLRSEDDDIWVPLNILEVVLRDMKGQMLKLCFPEIFDENSEI